MRDGPPLTRRQTLVGGTAGVAALLAGCTGDDGENGDDENGDGETATFETKQLGPAVGTPAWYRADDDRAGVVFLHDSPSIRTGSTAPQVEFDDEEIAQFVTETDFESQRLLRVEVAAPDGCHDRVEFDDLTIEDHTVVGEATATAPEDREGCDHALTVPRALVRVDTPVDLAALDVTDGWGETESVRSDDQPRFDPADLAGAVAPSGDPPAVPAPLDCDGQDRTTQVSDEGDIILGNGDDPGFVLRVDRTSYEYGDTATVRLTNTTMDWLATGNRRKYNLQVRTENGWQEVRTVDGSPPFYTDEAILHPPGDGFEWSLELTEGGLVGDHGDTFEVCPALQTGRYRFIYWPTDLAVEFDLTVE